MLRNSVTILPAANRQNETRTKARRESHLVFEQNLISGKKRIETDSLGLMVHPLVVADLRREEEKKKKTQFTLASQTSEVPKGIVPV